MQEGAHSRKNGFGKIGRKTAYYVPFSTRNTAQIGRNCSEISPTVKMGLRPQGESHVAQLG